MPISQGPASARCDRRCRRADYCRRPCMLGRPLWRLAASRSRVASGPGSGRANSIASPRRPAWGGEHPVSLGPGRPHLGVKLAEAARQRPQQRLADHRVVRGRSPVGDMAGTERLDLLDQRVEIVERADRHRQHGHELLLLLPEVVREQRAHLRRHLEQTVIEQVGGDVLDRQRRARSLARTSAMSSTVSIGAIRSSPFKVWTIRGRQFRSSSAVHGDCAGAHDWRSATANRTFLARGAPIMNEPRPRDLARRTADALAQRKRERMDGFRRDTFALPRDVAREKAREILRRFPKAAYMTEIEAGASCPTTASNSPCGACRARIEVSRAPICPWPDHLPARRRARHRLRRRARLLLLSLRVSAAAGEPSS